jgi:hypothetical protein
MKDMLSGKTVATFALIGGGVTFAGVGRLVELFLPGWLALTIGLVLGCVVMLALPILLGHSDLVVQMVIAIGGLVVLIGFVTQAGPLGVGLAVAIYLPVAVAVGALAWVLHTYVIPAATRPRRANRP